MGTKHGQGQPFQRSSDGRWIGRVRFPDGKVRHVTGRDRDDVMQRMTDLRLARTTSSSLHGGDALRDHVEKWFAEVAPVRYRPRTAGTNHRQARLHVLPLLGDIPIREVRPSDVQRMADRMTATGYAAQTVANVVHILSVVMRAAGYMDQLMEPKKARNGTT